MAKKKNTSEAKRPEDTNAYIEDAGIVIEEPITKTLETNYMPYAMSVIVSRAIPEIDGFKPSHRKILYTMYKMNLLSGNKTKSANVVGQTMKLNPHGDQSIYETMVRLTRGNEALLHPYIDSKGNFGKSYSRDMAYAASRYTEVKLDSICNELFSDIDKDTVDFVDNYDSTMKEPTLLPVTYPSILVNSNMGIAVGMASSISPFNLEEVCNTTIELMKNPNHNVIDTLKAPDFPTGGYIMYKPEEMASIYESGRGSFRMRARYNYDKANNCIEITEIPPNSTIEAIIDKIAENVKNSKIKEISDIRDETDLNGLKITIDLKRGIDPDKLMLKLFKLSGLEESFSCNFNMLIGGYPKVLGVKEILSEWTAYRRECVRRRVYYELGKKRDRLHLLKGLEKILLDIDKAVRIVRETEEESEVVPNLMIGFGIDNIQAEYVAEIKLRHLNREYILKHTAQIKALIEEIADLEDILAKESRIRDIIITQLKNVVKKYAKPRRSLLLYSEEEEVYTEEEVPDYAVNIFFTTEGYFKKITPQSLRMSGEQKLKEGDTLVSHVEAKNSSYLLFFTNMQQVYKARACDFDDTKASVLGDYLPAKLSMDENEEPIFMAVTDDYKGYIMFFFENGKAAKIELSAYETKTKRKKLLAAYNDKNPLFKIIQLNEDKEIIMSASNMRTMIFHSSLVQPKTTKNSQGVAVLTLKKNTILQKVDIYGENNKMNSEHRFRMKNLPAMGAFPKEEDLGEQLSL